MDLGRVAGYRWVLARHYDGVFRGMGPDQALRASRALERYHGRVLAALDLPDEGSLLDLGCGVGPCALAVARMRPRVRVVGVDASPEAVRVASETARREGLAHAAFQEGDAEAPPAGPHDRLVALSLFNLLPDKACALAAWRRVAKDSARLVLTDAFATGPRPATAPAREDAAGTGALGDPAFAAMLRRTGWRPVHREDLTPLVRRLHEEKAWPWGEYVRPGFRYLLHALQPA